MSVPRTHLPLRATQRQDLVMEWGLFAVAFLSVLVVSDACWIWTYGSWHSWGPCSASCGGGTRTRSKYSCVQHDERRESGSCNQICYHGGTFSNGCHCSPWRSGRCCLDCRRIAISHCKPGKQACGGSPDNIRCTECEHLYKPAGWGNGCRRMQCNDSNGGCQHSCAPVRGVPTCSCRQGFLLQNDQYSCMDINECSSGAAPCTQTCTNVPGSYQCSCRPGFSLDSDGYTCSDVDECLAGANHCQQLCINKPGTFSCDCQQGYTLDGDGRSCTEINECLVDNGGCDQVCINDPGSYHCECHSGYLPAADDTSCLDVDECKTGNARCSDHCTNTLGSYLCHCNPGLALSDDKFTCLDIDDCIGVTCHNGGTCINHVQSYVCVCDTGYTGVHCETDINECQGFVNGGCEDECVNTDGSYKCSCFENRTLDNDRHSCSGGTELQVQSIFQRESIFRQLLPRGCHTFLLSKCSEGEHVEFLLSSTAPWFQLASNASVVYTAGIVFAEVNDLSLPVSITGLTVEKTASDFRLMTVSLLYDHTYGIQLNETLSQHCWSFDLTPRDVHDFLTSNSFFKTFFANLDIKLPDWLSFSDKGSEFFELSGLKSDLLRGHEVAQTICRGAPVHSDRLYTMLRFNHEVTASFYGKEFTLPKSVMGEHYCILIDICRDLGGTIYLMLPPESRSMLDAIPLFEKLYDKYHIKLRPRGIGLSMKKSINAQSQGSSAQFWNGDTTFDYPISEKANFWIGVDAIMNQSIVRIQGGADVYLSVPSPLQLLEGVFHEEWDLRFAADVETSFIINMPLFGRTYYLDFGKAALGGYGSVGGEVGRTWCGETANPSGIFVSLFATVNPFLGIPILGTFGLNVDVKVYAFVASDPHQRLSTDNTVSRDTFDLISKLFSNLTKITRETSHKYNGILSDESKSLLGEVIQSGTDLEQRSVDISRSLGKSSSNNLVAMLLDLWGGLQKTLKAKVEKFIDSIEFSGHSANGQLTVILNNELNIIKTYMTNTLTRMTDEVFNLAKDFSGFGIKFQGELDIFHIKIIGADIELVYSVDRLGECNQHAKMFEIFKGEKAIRMKIGLSTKLVRVAPFIRLDVGSASTLAISIDTPERVLLQSEAVVKLFGVVRTESITITSRALTYTSELRVWDTFLAELQCSAIHNEDWNALTIDVHGRLLAKTDDGSSFQGSYLSGLRRIFQKVADGASDRIGAAQVVLTNAQAGLSKAQHWLEDKKEDVREADKYFDDAVSAMDAAKQKLEEAKGPFKRAIEKLNAAQRNVDNICRIRECQRICVPGIKCRICHTGGWIHFPYPCCHFTDCMFSFPDPICELANLGCRAIRGLAYIALEAAKIFVRIPMIALDVAKGLVSVAQIVVDKSRIVLDIAVAAIDLAKIGLEATKGVLELAKLALEGVKLLLKGAVKVLNFVIKEGLQRIIDVKNCQFHVQVGTQDPPVFDVTCQINPLMLGWVEIAIRINFKDSQRSLWNAAKGSVDSLVQTSFSNATERRKRDIKTTTLGKVHKLMRNTRDVNLDTDDIDIYLDEKINAIFYTPGVRNSSSFTDYENRVDIFKEKCDSYTFVTTFMIRANGVLLDMVNETAGVFDRLSSKSEQLESFDMDRLRETFSFHGSGINTSVAMEDYNITTDQMETVMNKTKSDIAGDPLLLEIQSMIGLSKEHVKTQQENIDQVQMVTQWVAAMENVSNTYFDINTCVSFIDCVHYTITTLYDLHEEEHFENVTISVDAISLWEDIFLNLTSNTTHSVQSVRNMSVNLESQIGILEESNVFCSTAPKLMSHPANATIGKGATVEIFCEATGDPQPRVWWFRNDELMENDTESILTIRNATENDTSIYRCVVGNIVANLTSDEAYVEVMEDYLQAIPSDNHSSSQDAQDLSVVIGTVLGSCAVVALLAGLIGWRRYKRYQFKKEAMGGSIVSMNIIRPTSFVAKRAFDPARIKVSKS